MHKKCTDGTYFQATTDTFFALYFILLPVDHQSTHISTRPQQVLPIQMTGERVSA